MLVLVLISTMLEKLSSAMQAPGWLYASAKEDVILYKDYFPAWFFVEDVLLLGSKDKMVAAWCRHQALRTIHVFGNET